MSCLNSLQLHETGVPSPCFSVHTFQATSQVARMSRTCSHALMQTEATCDDSWKSLSLQRAIDNLEDAQPSVEDLLCLLEKCTDERNVEFALRLHTYMGKRNLDVHPLLGDDLVTMLVEVGSIFEARHLFNRLRNPKEHTWNSLLDGYIRCGKHHEALSIYSKMLAYDSVHPTRYMCVCLLKACAELRDPSIGSKLHAHVIKMGFFKRDAVVGNAVVNMYAKCGMLPKAQEVFSDLRVRDVVSWNVLIASYTKHGCGEEALRLLEQMQSEGVLPNSVTYICCMKACNSVGNTDKAQQIHDQVIKHGLLYSDVCVGNALIDMYVKLGLLEKAQSVFDELPVRDVVSWTSLISGFAQAGHGQKALSYFNRMQHEGVYSNSITLVCSLNACASTENIETGKRVHDEITKKGFFEEDSPLGNALVDMYMKCGSFTEACYVFDMLPVQNVVSWTSLISGYAERGHGKEALSLLQSMGEAGICLNATTFVCGLKACSSLGAWHKGNELNIEICKRGLLDNDLILGNALVDMYATVGLLVDGQKVFDMLHARDQITWNALLSGYVKHGDGNQAITCFEAMQREGVPPNGMTFIFCLRACGKMGAPKKGQKIHQEITLRGLLEGDVSLGNAIIDMYMKCNSISMAQKVFEQLPVRDVISWTTLIAGYVEHGFDKEALHYFEIFKYEGLSPDPIMFGCILKACGSMQDVEKGQAIHDEIDGRGSLKLDHSIGGALVDMYVKCGFILKAREVFDGLPMKTLVAWTALISGYVQCGAGQEALKCFDQMVVENISVDSVTYICLLKACAVVGALAKGQAIHAEISRAGLLDAGSNLGNALIDMYSKCGMLIKAQTVFDNLNSRDEVSWTSLLRGYAQLGASDSVFGVYERMIEEGMKPTPLTFICVLNACSHTGLVSDGQMCFKIMNANYGIIPTVEHHTCIIDLLGRAGQLECALAVTETICTRSHDSVLWHTVLDACQKLGNLELGKQAFEQALQMDGADSAAYIFMSNMLVHTTSKQRSDVEALDVDHG